MRAMILILAVSMFAAVVGAAVYAAAQVSAGTWDTAVIMLASGISANIALRGVAHVISAKHPPPADNRQVTTIDKAVFLESGERGEVVKW